MTAPHYLRGFLPFPALILIENLQNYIIYRENAHLEPVFGYVSLLTPLGIPICTDVEAVDSGLVRILFAMSNYGNESIYMRDHVIECDTSNPDLFTYQYSWTGDTLIADNIQTTWRTCNPELCSVMYTSETGKRRLSVICWSQLDGDVMTVKARAVQTSGEGVKLSNILTVSGTTSFLSHQIDPQVSLVSGPGNECRVVVTWNAKEIGGNQQNQVICRSLRAYDAGNPGSIELEALTGCEVLYESEGVDLQYAASIDNSLCQPQNIAYDERSQRLVFCDRANHRVGWIQDPGTSRLNDLTPAPTSAPGCWVSEIETSREQKDNYWHGRLTRYNRNTGQYSSYGQMMSLGVNLDGSHSFELLTMDTDRQTIRDVEATIPMTDHVTDMTMGADLYSMTYLVYVTQYQDHSTLYWNVDGMWIKPAPEPTPGWIIDRPNHPYDVSEIPLQVMSPTPPGSTVTPNPTSTPYPPGYWVADMAGNRLVRVNYKNRILAETQSGPPVATPTWSPFENCAVIAPNAVSAAYDGSCWAIDWGRESVVKVNAEGTVVARSTPAWVPTILPTQSAIMHPVALDCAGDPNVCFVADYDGDMVYKVMWQAGTSEFQLVKSQASYFRPFALKVQKGWDQLGVFQEYVWVSDRWDLNPSPVPGTWTPHPTPTPRPPPTFTAPPGNPTYTPQPEWTATPYPQKNRVSRNQFSWGDLFPVISSSIPINLSPVGTIEDYHGWVSDRDSNKQGNNKVMVIEPSGVTWYPVEENPPHPLIRPVDIEGVQP